MEKHLSYQSTLTFEDLNLSDCLLKAVREEGYSRPTPIQEKSIPHVLRGSDLLGCAQTGTGKTAAFALPLLQRLCAAAPQGPGRHALRALILSPTRELAAQIDDSIAAYGRHTGLRHTAIFGGVGQGSQAAALRRGVDIVVATPGRLLDLMGQGLISLRAIEILVLDEADRMLDMGFIPDIRRIVATISAKRQTLFFSATLSPDIERLAAGIVKNPVRVEAAPAATTLETIAQRVYMVEQSHKNDLLVHLLKNPAVERALVFTRTKHRADRLVLHLEHAGVRVQAIHGNKSQNNRQRALAHFKRGVVRVLVATDIAARGLDVDGISHVFNFDISGEPEVYVHRIGRTGRADATGVAISFCSPEERESLTAIRRLTRVSPELVQDDTFHPRPAHEPARPAPAAASRSGKRQYGGRPRGRR
jgi:ATP-dependent RNA helicase RhlE